MKQPLHQILLVNRLSCYNSVDKQQVAFTKATSLVISSGSLLAYFPVRLGIGQAGFLSVPRLKQTGSFPCLKQNEYMLFSWIISLSPWVLDPQRCHIYAEGTYPGFPAISQTCTLSLFCLQWPQQSMLMPLPYLPGSPSWIPWPHWPFKQVALTSSARAWTSPSLQAQQLLCSIHPSISVATNLSKKKQAQPYLESS